MNIFYSIRHLKEKVSLNFLLLKQLEEKIKS